jgi:hypothetical protein
VSPTTASGKLTLLFNDHGVFTVGTTQALGFAPGSLAASNRLRAGGKTDLLIRDANANRFLFLVNIEPDPSAFRPAIGPNQGFFDGAGNVDALLVGNVAHGGPHALDDVVTFDHDMTLKTFVNNGLESFALRTVATANDPHFAGAQPPYLLADFGGGTLALAAPVVAAGGQVGMLLLQGDGAGGFTPVTGEVPLQQPRGTGTSAAVTTFVQSQGSIPGFTAADIKLRQSVVAQFRSALHGNSKPDFAVITKASAASRNGANCPGDTQHPPPPTPLRQPVTCPIEQPSDNGGSFPGECPHEPHGICPPGPPDFEGPCCFCAESRVPPAKRCPSTCDFPPGPPVPFQAVCTTTTTFTPAVSVFGNTCGD